MKIVKILVAAMLLMGTAESCTDLKSEMYDTINTNIFPKNADDANALVTAAAYGPFRSEWSGVFSSAQGGIHVFTEMTTDIGDCQWDADVWNDLRNVNFTSNSDGAIAAYKNYINFISKMTLTMDRISRIDMDETEKARLMAELHCGRGWLAYILYDLYGPIQVASKELLEDPLNDNPAPRLSQEEMVKFIEDDLKAAMVLPARYDKGDSNYGRFTRGLAYTVLMKLYMHEKQWQKAADCGKELAKAEYGLGLMDSYKDIFTLENEGNKEAVWSVVCNLSDNPQMWHAHVLSSPYPTKNPNIQKWGGYRVLWSFYHTFDPADKRLEVLVGDFQGTDGHHYTEADPNGVLTKGAMPVKYGEDPNSTSWIVYRYADVLTLRAEALVRAGNAITQEALDCLNAVHTRAGLTAYQMSDFTDANDFLDKVLLERGHELWFEGARRTDLIRYGKYIEYAKKYKGSTTAQDYMNVMPLPQSVIDESKGKIAQNPGY